MTDNLFDCSAYKVYGKIMVDESYAKVGHMAAQMPALTQSGHWPPLPIFEFGPARPGGVSDSAFCTKRHASGTNPRPNAY